MADIRLASYADLQAEIQNRENADNENSSNLDTVSEVISELTERVRILEGTSGWSG